MHSHGASSGNEKRQSISPGARLSKLNKRRRPPKDGSNFDAEQQIQRRMSLSSAAATISASKRSHFLHGEGNEGDAFANDGHCKENLLNGRPAFHARNVNDAAGGGRTDMFLTATTREAADTTTMAAMHSQADGKDEKRNPSSLSASSALGFIDHMDKSILLSTIASVLGIDPNIMCKSSTIFKQTLERSFDCKFKHIDAKFRLNKNQPDDNNAVYHNVLGRINPPSVVDSSATTRHRCESITDELPSFAFPPYKSSSLQHESINDSRFMISQHRNDQRKTGHGLCLPSSWYCFPKCSKIQELPPSLEKKSVKHSIDERGYKRKNECYNEEQNIEMNKKEPSILSRCKLSASPSNPPRKCQGKIRIESERGATIREVFDIEKSNFVIGKLNLGDERYYLEKKVLPPPPISLLDESDHENESDYDDDECVAVVRYKICLNPVDLAELQCGDNPLVGWISDRGRLANDPYLILREI